MMYDVLLIYDGKCTYCTGIAEAFKKADDVKAVDWNDERVQSFLDAQFGWEPFAMMVVSDNTVYVGENATEHLTERVGVPAPVTKFAKSQTGTVSTVVSKLARRRDADDINGEFPLDEEAEEYVDDLIGGTDIEF